MPEQKVIDWLNKQEQNTLDLIKHWEAPPQVTARISTPPESSRV